MLDIDKMKSVIEQNRRNLSIDEWIYETKLNPFLPTTIKEELLDWLTLKASLRNLPR